MNDESQMLPNRDQLLTVDDQLMAPRCGAPAAGASGLGAAPAAQVVPWVFDGSATAGWASELVVRQFAGEFADFTESLLSTSP